MNRILSHLMEILSNKRNISISYLTFASRSHFEASAWIMDPSAMIEISHHAHFQSRVNVFWELSVDKFPRRLTSHKLIDIRHLIQPEKGTKIVKMTYFFTILTFINHFHENSYREVNFWVVQFYNLLWLRYRFLFNPMPILSFHFLSIFLLAFSVVVRFFWTLVI